LITTAAGNIWKMMGNDQKSCESLFFQMRKYKLRSEPYEEEYKASDETITAWWLATDDTESYLQELALYVLSQVTALVVSEFFQPLDGFMENEGFAYRHQKLNLWLRFDHFIFQK